MPLDLKFDIGGSGGSGWSDDSGLTITGGTATFGSGDTIDLSLVTDPPPNAVVADVRYIDSNMSITVPGVTMGTQYAVRLYFREFAGAAARTFHIDIDSVRKLTNFNINDTAGAVGKLVEIVRVVEAAGSSITILLTKVTVQTQISAIRITEVAPAYLQQFICVEDSITYGYGIGSVTDTYPHQLAVALEANSWRHGDGFLVTEDPEKTKLVKNWGVNSEPTDSFLKAIEVRVGAYLADAVVTKLIFLGVFNDFNYGASAATALTRVAAVKTWCDDNGVEFIPITMLPNGTYPTDTATYNTGLASAYPDKLIPAKDDPRLDDETDATYYQGDEIHPTAAGALALADVVYTALTSGQPTVEITSPEADAVVEGNIHVIGTCADVDGQVVSVQLKLNGVNWGSAFTDTDITDFDLVRDTTDFTNGDYTLTAVVTDDESNTTPSEGVAITINNSGEVEPDFAPFEIFDHAKMMNVNGMGWLAPLLEANFGGGFGAGIIANQDYGLHHWQIASEFLPDNPNYDLDALIDDETVTQSYFEYVFQFFIRHILRGNKPFIIKEHRTNKYYLVRFAMGGAIDFGRVTAKFFTNEGIQVEEARTNLEGFTFADDGSVTKT